MYFLQSLFARDPLPELSGIREAKKALAAINTNVANLSFTQTLIIFFKYNRLQDIIMRHFPEDVLGELPKEGKPKEAITELKQICGECNFYCRLAVGVYGDMANFGASLQAYKLLNPNDRTDEVLKLTRVDPEQLVDYNWQSLIYCPAYGIFLLKERKEVVLAIRGTESISDAVTDLIAEYIKFTIVDIPVSEKSDQFDRALRTYEIKVKSQSEGAAFEEMNEQGKKFYSSSKEKKVLTGYAHSGIFLAGVRLFDIVRPK